MRAMYAGATCSARSSIAQISSRSGTGRPGSWSTSDANAHNTAAGSNGSDPDAPSGSSERSATSRHGVG